VLQHLAFIAFSDGSLRQAPSAALDQVWAGLLLKML
jgi:hypothetical protein